MCMILCVSVRHLQRKHRLDEVFILYQRPKPHQKFHYSLECIDLDSLLAIPKSIKPEAHRQESRAAAYECPKQTLQADGISQSIVKEVL